MSKKSKEMAHERYMQRMKEEQEKAVEILNYWANLEIENRYNLKHSDIKRMRVIDFKRIKEKPFWWNRSLKKWCLIYPITIGIIGSGKEWDVAEYWIGFDEDGKIEDECYNVYMNTICRFEIFLDESENFGKIDRAIQNVCLYHLNWILDEKIVELQ